MTRFLLRCAGARLTGLLTEIIFRCCNWPLIWIEAVKVGFEFYKTSSETLIVVTADHETGRRNSWTYKRLYTFDLSRSTKRANKFLIKTYS